MKISKENYGLSKEEKAAAIMNYYVKILEMFGKF